MRMPRDADASRPARDQGDLAVQSTHGRSMMI
jgi:hypothetical protein